MTHFYLEIFYLQNMKKIVLTALLSLPIACFANCNAAKRPFTGIFVGGGAGASLMTGEHVYTAGSILSADSGKLAMRGFGLVVNAVAGYMHLTEGKTWFAGELYFNAKTTKAKKDMNTNSNQGTVEIKNKNTFGLAALIGTPLNPRVIMYAKAGFEMGSFSFKYTNLTTTPSEKSISKRLNSVIPSAGVMYSMTDSLLLGGEYAYAVSTKKIKISDTEPTADFKPAEHRLVGSIRYVF